MNTKFYLGDSVYVEVLDDGFTIRLTTENGRATDPSNSIYIDLSMLDTLNSFIQQLKERAANAPSP